MERIKNLRREIEDTYRPVIGVICTGEVQEICAKNNVDLATLLSPFAHQRNLKNPLVTPHTEARISEINPRFVHIEQIGAVPTEYADAMTWKVLSKVLPNNNQFGYSPYRVKNQEEAAEFANSSQDPLPWFSLYRRQLHRGLEFTEHEMFGHPVAFLIVSSTLEADPISSMKQLTSSAYLPAAFASEHFNPDVPKFYLLLHDICAGQVGDVDPSSVFSRMQGTFPSSTCYQLSINSLPPASPNLEQTDLWERHLVPHFFESHVMNPLLEEATVTAIAACAGADVDKAILHPKDDDSDNPTARGVYLSPDDLMSIKTFVARLVQDGVVPVITRKMEELHAHIASMKKGLKNALKSWWRKPRESPPVQGKSKSWTQGVQATVQYPYASIEGEIRLLADLAFMVKDYELALSHYRMVREDFKSDKAYKHYAGAMEMIGLCQFMSHGPSREIENILDHAASSYYKSAEAAMTRGFASTLPRGQTQATLLRHLGPMSPQQTPPKAQSAGSLPRSKEFRVSNLSPKFHPGTPGKAKNLLAELDSMDETAGGGDNGGGGGGGGSGPASGGVGFSSPSSPHGTKDAQHVKKLCVRLATRARLWLTELRLATTSVSNAPSDVRTSRLLETATLYQRMAQAEGERDLSCAIFTEQAAVCHLRHDPPLFRKHAFLLCLAGQQYSLIRLYRLAVNAYTLALSSYGDNQWLTVDDHIHRALARNLAAQGDIGTATEFLGRILAYGAQRIDLSAQQLILRYFYKFFSAWRQRELSKKKAAPHEGTVVDETKEKEDGRRWWETSMWSAAELRDVSIPLVDIGTLRVCNWENAASAVVATEAIAEMFVSGKASPQYIPAAEDPSLLSTSQESPHRPTVREEASGNYNTPGEESYIETSSSVREFSAVESEDPLGFISPQSPGPQKLFTSPGDASFPRSPSRAPIRASVAAMGGSPWHFYHPKSKTERIQHEQQWDALAADIPRDLNVMKKLAKSFEKRKLKIRTHASGAGAGSGAGATEEPAPIANDSVDSVLKPPSWRSYCMDIAQDAETAAEDLEFSLSRGPMSAPPETKAVSRYTGEAFGVCVFLENPTDMPLQMNTVHLVGEVRSSEDASEEPLAPWEVEVGPGCASTPIDIAFGPRERKEVRMTIRPLRAGTLTVNYLRWSLDHTVCIRQSLDLPKIRLFHTPAARSKGLRAEDRRLEAKVVGKAAWLGAYLVDLPPSTAGGGSETRYFGQGKPYAPVNLQFDREYDWDGVHNQPAGASARLSDDQQSRARIRTLKVVPSLSQDMVLRGDQETPSLRLTVGEVVKGTLVLVNHGAHPVDRVVVKADTDGRVWVGSVGLRRSQPPEPTASGIDGSLLAHIDSKGDDEHPFSHIATMNPAESVTLPLWLRGGCPGTHPIRLLITYWWTDEAGKSIQRSIRWNCEVVVSAGLEASAAASLSAQSLTPSLGPPKITYDVNLAIQCSGIATRGYLSHRRYRIKQVLALSCDWVLKASPEVVSRLRSSSLQPGDTLTLPLTLTRRPRVGLCDENEDETAADSQTYYQGPFWSAISAVPIEPSEEEGEMFDKEGTVVSALCREHGYRIKKAVIAVHRDKLRRAQRDAEAEDAMAPTLRSVRDEAKRREAAAAQARATAASAAAMHAAEMEQEAASTPAGDPQRRRWLSWASQRRQWLRMIAAVASMLGEGEDTAMVKNAVEQVTSPPGTLESALYLPDVLHFCVIWEEIDTSPDAVSTFSLSQGYTPGGTAEAAARAAERRRRMSGGTPGSLSLDDSASLSGPALGIFKPETGALLRTGQLQLLTLRLRPWGRGISTSSLEPIHTTPHITTGMLAPSMPLPAASLVEGSGGPQKPGESSGCPVYIRAGVALHEGGRPGAAKVLSEGYVVRSDVAVEEGDVPEPAVAPTASLPVAPGAVPNVSPKAFGVFGQRLTFDFNASSSCPVVVEVTVTNGASGLETGCSIYWMGNCSFETVLEPSGTHTFRLHAVVYAPGTYNFNQFSVRVSTVTGSDTVGTVPAFKFPFQLLCHIDNSS